LSVSRVSFHLLLLVPLLTRSSMAAAAATVVIRGRRHRGQRAPPGRVGRAAALVPGTLAPMA
jgi:hypothetical protein